MPTNNIVAQSVDSRWRLLKPSWYAALSRQERRFWWLCLFLLFIVFSPSKAAGLFASLFFMVGILFWARVLPQRHITRYVFFFMIYTFIGIVYFILLPDYSFINHYLFLLTFSGAFLLFYDFRPVASHSLLKALSKLVLVILFVQGCYGIVQGIAAFARLKSFDLAGGDYIRGTLEPGFGSTASASNQMFAILMTTLLLFAIATQPQKLSSGRLLTYVIVFVAWLMASVFHTFLFFGGAVVLAILILWRWYYRRPRRSFYTRILYSLAFIFGGIFVFGFITVALPRNLSTLPHFINVTLDLQNGSDKARATHNTITKLPQDLPMQPLTGLGPGQYSSRAALIRTGEYIRGSDLPLPPYVSPSTDKYIMIFWRTFFLRYPNGGSTYFPYYSWLSLYGEWGLMGTIGVLIFLGISLLRWRRTSNTIYFPYMPRAMVILILYIALLGFQDNYWEFVQAIAPAFLFLALGRAYQRRSVVI